ncbi:MAG: outer membrane protein, partial [Planctomycetota bacterium]
SKLIDIKRDELFRPLYKKIGAALQIVAEAQGYTLIMQTNESMVYIDATTDVTRSVITQLGIEIKE